MCRTVYIHLLSLQDGSVYSTPPSGRVAYEFPSRTPTTFFYLTQLAVTRSRVMARLVASDETSNVMTVVVWDVKTGDPVRSL